VTAQWSDIPSGRNTFGGYLSLPKGGNDLPLSLLEIFGVNVHTRNQIRACIAPRCCIFMMYTEYLYDRKRFHGTIGLQDDVFLCPNNALTPCTA
jgi:hypothetical protein